eukprot:m51a1_g361 putative gtpase activating protein gyp1 (458) ;mRNA; r:595992-597763
MDKRDPAAAEVSDEAKASVGKVLQSRAQLSSSAPLADREPSAAPRTSAGEELAAFWQKTRKVPGSVVKSVRQLADRLDPMSPRSSLSPDTAHLSASASLSLSVPASPAVPPVPPHTTPPAAPLSLSAAETADSRSLKRFQALLAEPVIDLDALRKLSWKGIPDQVRAEVWKLLLGYAPAVAERREETQRRKRGEYHDTAPRLLGSERTANEETILHQICIDLPRTCPTIPLFQHPRVQKMLERILYMWAGLHPASGYVQGINDLVTPIVLVFVGEQLGTGSGLESGAGVDAIPESTMRDVEADSFWCLSKLLDGIQDNYTAEQPGIQRSLRRLAELVQRIDAPLAQHFEEQGASYVQFAFRWINCLLLRELPLLLIVRMWDTYLSEAGGFSTLHVYVCAAFLLTWSRELRQREFQDMMIMLQHLPTDAWTTADVEVILSQAYVFMTLYHDAPHHLKQ